MENMKEKQHFVLVHGACHGAWCWYKLVNLLKVAGHRATALDLGASGVNSKQLNDVVSVSDYVQPLMQFMASIPNDEKVILVGHSYAGLCISLAMEAFPGKISLAVFISAYLPNHTSPPGILIQEDLELAKMLVRPTRLFLEELSKEGVLTEANYGSVNRVSILCEEDEVMEEEFQRWMIKNSPTQQVISIKEVGHMVMLSKPQELCNCLLKLQTKFDGFK
ncbi:hypothetical protein FEM48_Zijuj08G0110400 [Ziziphus jujuba var. spinosa]|uniref:AB hydrolase-1 domain-containing protein n=1 Tax=Ziziphus jujuba var. spinosa TaxID=714518 RepID=A0A978UYQ5_ZIZJJ|nr:hypothetical protein FEM48_Zijuj08G0110400 [Ziziphus jujuba var. spinosa]